jgi:hypothetical protein
MIALFIFAQVIAIMVDCCCQVLLSIINWYRQIFIIPFCFRQRFMLISTGTNDGDVNLVLLKNKDF